MGTPAATSNCTGITSQQAHLCPEDGMMPRSGASAIRIGPLSAWEHAGQIESGGTARRAESQTFIDGSLGLCEGYAGRRAVARNGRLE
eukprot:scaffold86948_cov33-Tisochrysis_lutea.AAC.2